MKLRRDRMLELLAIKKMNQRMLAAAIGASPSLVSHVLNGRRKLNLKQSRLLIELFGADLVSKLINWKAMRLIRPLGEA